MPRAKKKKSFRNHKTYLKMHKELGQSWNEETKQVYSLKAVEAALVKAHAQGMEVDTNAPLSRWRGGRKAVSFTRRFKTADRMGQLKAVRATVYYSESHRHNRNYSGYVMGWGVNFEALTPPTKEQVKNIERWSSSILGTGFGDDRGLFGNRSSFKLVFNTKQEALEFAAYHLMKSIKYMLGVAIQRQENSLREYEGYAVQAKERVTEKKRSLSFLRRTQLKF